MRTATMIMVDGPYSNRNDDCDEVPEWTVCAADDEANEIGKIYYCSSYESAIDLGRRMAKERHLELSNEATRA